MERVNKNSNFGRSEMPKPKETISLAGVFMFLGFLFLILVSFLIYLRFSNLSPLSDFYHKIKTTETGGTLSLQDQLKLSSPQSLHLKVSEDELKSAISLDSSDFPIKNATLTIKPEGIFISGKNSDKLWGIPVTLTLKPRAENGKLLFDITEIKTLGIVAPASFTSNITNNLNLRLVNVIPVKDKITVLSAELALGHISIEGKEE